MSPPSESQSVRIERTFDAPAETVFDAWISPEVLRRWWHAEHDWETPFAEVDAREGGSLRIVMRNPVDGTEHGGGGYFTHLDRPRRLAYIWTWDSNPELRQLVDVEFHETAGRTTVILSNGGIPQPEVGDYQDGWNDSFDNLAKALRI
jgi:uncharacterized protein YndB with AHSA1/START domain